MQSTPHPKTENLSYAPGQVEGGYQVEFERLRQQVELGWPMEHRRLLWAGLEDGHSLLEVGCGPGYYTKRLRQAFPHSSIVAVDNDRTMIDKACQLTSADIPRVQLVVADACQLDLPSASVDAAISRYLYQHLSDPVAAAAEVSRVLRPGGRHVIIDIDDDLWGIVSPESSLLRRLNRLLAELQAERGGNRTIGRHLARILTAAGCSQVELDVFAYQSDDVGLGSFASQFAPERFLPLVEQELITPHEYACAVAITSAFLQSEEAFILKTVCIAHGIKRHD